MVAGGGARIDDEPVRDAGAMIDLTDDDKKISAGKKKHGLLRKV
jgi:tyrosyl-tRNA synthetase